MNDEIASFLRNIRSATTDSEAVGEALIFCDRLDELGQLHRSGWMRDMLATSNANREVKTIIGLFVTRCPRGCYYRHCEVCDGMGNVYLSEEYCCTPEKVEEVSGEGYVRGVSGPGSGHVVLSHDYASNYGRMLHSRSFQSGEAYAETRPARSVFASGLNPSLLRSGHAYIGMVGSGMLSNILPANVCPKCYGFGFTLFYHMNGIKSYVQAPYLR